MQNDVYKKLARRLHDMPNGFEVTPSGMSLLAKLFTSDEAQLASEMSEDFEPPARIAERVGLSAPEAEERLTAMARRGLIRQARGADDVSYALMPFAVGIYEESLPRMDAELASLFERYYEETKGGAMNHGSTPLHRFIPVGESVPVNLEIFPHEQASQYIEGARSWGVRDCICRVQQRLIGKGCDNPIENCIVFAPVEGAFENSDATRPITKEEALRILKQSADAGLVHSTMNQKGQIFYICNCCTCCCGILRGVKEFGIPTAVARSDFRVSVDAELCTGCGLCAERCQFDALRVVEGTCAPDYARCVGCGVCVSICPVSALSMERRPTGEVEEPPANKRAWLARRRVTQAGEAGATKRT